MNYPFQFGIFGPGDANATLAYSRGKHIRLDENSLNEADGIGGTGSDKTFRITCTFNDSRYLSCISRGGSPDLFYLKLPETD
jgi:hypothetical protein